MPLTLTRASISKQQLRSQALADEDSSEASSDADSDEDSSEADENQDELYDSVLIHSCLIHTNIPASVCSTADTVDFISNPESRLSSHVKEESLRGT